MNNSEDKFTLIFEIPGFDSIKIGSFKNTDDCPKEFNLNLSKSAKTKIKVVTEKDNLPIAYEIVSINNIGSSQVKKIQTDEFGEISVEFLIGKFKVEVDVNEYSPFSQVFDIENGKEFIVKISRGGTLKGHLSIAKNERASLHLSPSNINAQFNLEGNIEITNLATCDYSLSLFRQSTGKDGFRLQIPEKVKIENDKICEINFDEYLNNQASLEFTIFKDGVLSNETGNLFIDGEVSMGFESRIKNGYQLFEMVLPGRRQIVYQYQEKKLALNVDVIANQRNSVELFLPSAKLMVIAKNEEGIILSNILVSLNQGEIYRSEEELDNQIVQNNFASFDLLPKVNYNLKLEGDATTNYEIKIVSPIKLEVGQQNKIEVILGTARKLPNIQIVDEDGKPLEKVSFAIIDDKGNYIRRAHIKDFGFYPFTNSKGFLPENGWPKSKFILMVSKNGYEFQELEINADFNPEKTIQIILKKPSSIVCSFPQPFEYPISVGLLKSNGQLLKKPIGFSDYSSSTFFQDVSEGVETFENLKADTYYIGYFWNGATNRLISKQGPFTLGVGQRLEVICNLQFNK